MVRLPPGPRSRYPGSHLVAFRRSPLDFLQRLARDYGDVAAVSLGRTRIFLVSDPELIKDVLVTHHQHFHKGPGLQRAKHLVGEGLLTSEGEHHRRQRRLAQPAFHQRRLATYGDLMVTCAEATGERWRSGPAQVDVHQEMLRLTLAIVGRTLLGSDIEGDAAEIGRAVAASLAVFQRFSMLPFASLLERLPLPAVIRFERARARLEAIISHLIETRRAEGADRGDLLSMLLLATDEENPGDRMTDVQLRDEALTILLAGHETVANALSWTWYLLARHPEVESRLHAELSSALGERRPTAEDLPRLDYARRIVAEALRLYPPAWVIGRRAMAPLELGGWVVPGGTVVLMSPWVTQRDPRWFPEPERFDPERWTDAARGDRPRFSYFPFGGGPRVCIGEHFAWMEAVLVLTTLARTWRPGLVPGAQVALQPSVTLRPRHGLPMELRAR